MTVAEYNNGIPLWADDVMRFASRCSDSFLDAEDAVQEAFASLWQHRSDVAADKGKGYLLSAAYRHLMRCFRHRSVVARHAQFLVPEGQVRPDEHFDLKEALAASMKQLPPVQRAILHLRDVEGYSYHDIAAELQISDDQVQVYLFRARIAMRKHLSLLGYNPQS